MTATAPPQTDELQAAYRAAFTDWLACAAAGAGERAARAVRASGEDLLADVAFAGTAGHVLDFDDTFSDGVAHVSAATAPAALVVAAARGRSLQAALEAYAEGYEAMARVAAAGHPTLYDAGWHPTAVCGPVGAAVAAAVLLDLSPEQGETALAIALLRAGGTRGAFGSDGKAIQVGLAAAAGVQGALLARAGAVVDESAIHGPLGFSAVVGARWPEGGVGVRRPEAEAGGDRTATDDERGPAITRNWIKLHPSCLGTHSPIDAADAVRAAGAAPGAAEPVQVAVHPLARQAAHLDLVDDGLAAKFSIPYCVAFTLQHGAPGREAFAAIDHDVRERSRTVTVTVDRALPEFGAVLSSGGRELGRIECPRGAPGRPVTAAELDAKVRALAGDRLDGVLADPEAPAARALAAAGLSRAAAG